MAGSDSGTISGLLKNVYGPYLERQQNLKHYAYDEIAKSSKNYNAGGNGFFGAINDYGNESVGAITESETFRTIDSEDYQQFKVVPKINVAPIQFTGLMAEVANSDPEAFANSVVDALDMAKERLQKDVNRQFFGYGLGVLGNPQGAISSSATSLTVNSAQYFRRNMVVDFMSAAGVTNILVTGYRVQDVDKAANVIYFSVQLTNAVTTGNVICKEKVAWQSSPPADGKEMMGLRGIVDDSTDLTTFQNIAASNRIWRGVRISSTTNLTSDLLQRLLDDVRILGGESPDLIFMHHLQRRKYLDIVVPQKRYQDQKLDAGHSALSFNGIDLMLDEDCQTDTVYALTRKFIQRFEVLGLSLGKYDGSDTYLRMSNQDVFQAYWRMYANFGTSKRNAHGKIVGLTTPSGIS
jgi:hypothetical protein